MTEEEFCYEATLGGPGLTGYMYKGDVYCPDCGKEVVFEIAAKVAPAISGVDDRSFCDSQTVPQPMFFAEFDCDEYCARCEERL